MRQYSTEELGKRFNFRPPLLFLRAIGAIILARAISFAYCTIPSLKPIVDGIAAFWLLFVALVALSAYSNVQGGKPAIGAGEGKMLLLLGAIFIIWLVGYYLELERGMQCH